MKLNASLVCLIFVIGTSLTACQPGDEAYTDLSTIDNNTESVVADTDSEDVMDHIHDDVKEGESEEAAINEDIVALGCVRPSSSQRSSVNLGLSKKEKFLQRCVYETGSTTWCAQVARPNPSSRNTFACTYGSSQAHNLIHPDESTWRYPIAGIKILKDLQAKGVRISHIYNWWRPEPYNKNVGGAAGRHPYGTSIDVRFSSNSEANKAFAALCKMRAQGRLRAIGHYGSASLHIGVGDRTANTWGKYCN